MVGQFPDGASPGGALDMSGNVWEWTNSWYDKKQVYRVLRGGSWFVNQDSARCAFRFGFLPEFFSFNLGFRILSPGFIPGS